MSATVFHGEVRVEIDRHGYVCLRGSREGHTVGLLFPPREVPELIEQLRKALDGLSWLLDHEYPGVQA